MSQSPGGRAELSNVERSNVRTMDGRRLASIAALRRLLPCRCSGGAAMAKARTVFLGAGCLLLLLGTVIMVILVRGLAAPSLPGEMVLSLRLAGPIVEVAADDPLAELMGEQPTSMRGLREILVRAAEDPKVRGLRLRVDGIGGGFANAQELRRLIARVGRPASGRRPTWTPRASSCPATWSTTSPRRATRSRCTRRATSTSSACRRGRRSSRAPSTSSTSAPSSRAAATTRRPASCTPRAASPRSTAR
jgi:hypothetical protein